MIEKQIDVLSVVEQLLGIYYTGSAQWTKAENSFKNAIEVVMPQTVGGDPKTYEVN